MKSGKQYREYRTITREQANARGFDLKYLNVGHDMCRARRLFDQYPDAKSVDFCQRGHNTSKSRYVPAQGVIIYIKSIASPLYGKKAATIPHKELKEVTVTGRVPSQPVIQTIPVKRD